VFPAGPAAAVSTYTASYEPYVMPGQSYTDEIFNRITVDVPSQVPPGDYNLYMRLPSDFYTTVAEAVYADLVSEENQIIQVLNEPVGQNKSGTGAYNEWEFTLTFGESGTMGRFFIDLGDFHAPTGALGDVNATFEAQRGSPFSKEGTVKVASVTSGSVKVSVEKVNLVTSGSGEIGTVRIEEDRQGALKASPCSLKLKLPQGFTWDLGGQDATLIWGDSGVLPDQDGGFTLADNDTGLMIDCPQSSTKPTYYSISGLKINVDETHARGGDIEVSVDGGDSMVDSPKVVMAKYGDYKCALYADEPFEARAGYEEECISNIIIEETAPGTLREGGSIILTLTGESKWSHYGSGAADDPYKPSGPPILDIDKSVCNSDFKLAEWNFKGDDYKIISTTVVKGSAGQNKGAKLVFKDTCFNLPADAAGDIEIKVGGSAGVSGEIVGAKAYTPVTLSIEGSAPDIINGQKDQAIADIIIAEAAAEAIPNLTNQYTTIDGVSYPRNLIWLDFPKGIIPEDPAKVEVVEGDLVIDEYYLEEKSTHWRIVIETLYYSTKPSKIKISGIKITADRTIPEGPVEIELKGPGLLKSIIDFPNVDSMSSVVVASNVTPAPKKAGISASFKIGETSYVVNGVEKDMDAAAFVENGRTYLPMRYAAYALGLTDSHIVWDAAGSTATFIKDNKVVMVKDGDKAININGVPITMDVPARLRDGRFVVPFRFIAQAFGASVEWDGTSQTVTMNL
jgi:hypothetical protein